jgi:hypothetical protein
MMSPDSCGIFWLTEHLFPGRILAPLAQKVAETKVKFVLGQKQMEREFALSLQPGISLSQYYYVIHKNAGLNFVQPTKAHDPIFSCINNGSIEWLE